MSGRWKIGTYSLPVQWKRTVSHSVLSGTGPLKSSLHYLEHEDSTLYSVTEVGEEEGVGGGE